MLWATLRHSFTHTCLPTFTRRLALGRGGGNALHTEDLDTFIPFALWPVERGAGGWQLSLSLLAHKAAGERKWPGDQCWQQGSWAAGLAAGSRAGQLAWRRQAAAAEKAWQLRRASLKLAWQRFGMENEPRRRQDRQDLLFSSPHLHHLLLSIHPMPPCCFARHGSMHATPGGARLVNNIKAQGIF